MNADDPLRDLADVHYKLSALAGLLQACGSPMEAEQVAGAGVLVAEQSRRLGEMMNRHDRRKRREKGNHERH